ncbi:hypothetical protein D9M73_82560 [compost metagenome]
MKNVQMVTRAQLKAMQELPGRPVVIGSVPLIEFNFILESQDHVNELLSEDEILYGTMMYQTLPDGTKIRIPPPQARR